MKKSSRFVMLGLAAFAFTGCHKETTVPTGTASPQPSASLAAPRSKAVVYVVNPKSTGDQDELMPRTIALQHPDNPVRDAVEALLQASGSPLPAGITLRGISIDNGVATLDFSRSPINESGGENGQGDALAALARTLGQFPEIRQYQIKVKGQPLKSFGEEGTVSGPRDVLRPAAAEQGHGMP